MAIDLDRYKPTPAGQFPPFLTGTDIGNKKKVKITDVREATFTDRNAVVLDVDIGKGDVKSFVLNKTNMGVAIQLLGEDTDKWIKKALTLITIPVRNPRTNEMTKGIRIQL